jgi:geranylgeranyl diphosphate synthase type II
VDTDLLGKNPMAAVRPPKLDTALPNALADSQRRALLTYLDAAASTPFNLAVFIAISTGMREGEICGLRWSDVSFETRTDVAEAEYIEMIRLKTSVLLACALKMGALLAGASSDDADLLYRVGEQTGLAFQLQDDLLDVYGDPKVFGKAIGGDITSNKKTYMLINAFNRADDRQRAELSRWISAPTFDRQEKISAVTRLYDEIGIRSLCEEKINHYFNEACKHLDQVAVAEERKAALRQYIAAMMKREF